MLVVLKEKKRIKNTYLHLIKNNVYNIKRSVYNQVYVINRLVVISDKLRILLILYIVFEINAS